MYMDTKPIIGITWYCKGDPCERGRLSDYYEAINHAQGKPRILRAKRGGEDPGPLKRGRVNMDQCVSEIGEDEEDFEQSLKGIDGMLLTGDRDIHPGWYGEEKFYCTEASQRAKFDLKLAQLALNQEIPILGICLGPQVINVACGGTLNQAISGAPGKRNHYNVCHLTRILPDSKLRHIFQQDELWTNSFHHQAVKYVGTGLRVCARSDDDVVEAVELDSDTFILGVQWHPEKYIELVKKENLHSRLAIFVDTCRRLFSAFVREAAMHRK